MIFLPDDNHSKKPEIIPNNENHIEKPSTIKTKKPTSNFCYRHGDPDGDGSD